MSHPGPLLADYVDGTLDPSARATVDAHLRTCATCRDEVALADAGARAAQGVPEPRAPEGLGDAAIAEASRMATERNPEVTSIAGRARRRPTTSRVLAAAGAAAAVLLLVIVAPKLGQNSSSDFVAANGAASASGTAVAYRQATGVETQHVNYTFAALPRVLSGLRSALTAEDGAVAASADQPGAGAEATALPSIAAQPDASVDASQLPEATACLRQASPKQAGTLSRVIRASYEGQPAYLGVYLIGPGADLPPTQLQVTVASVQGCQLLNQATARL
jgi:anti-sigma factor RsiW